MSEKNIAERDPDTGRIVKSTLTSEKAREMAKKSHEKRRMDGVNEVLRSLGYGDMETAPAHIVELARQGVQQNRTSALMNLIKMQGEEMRSKGKELSLRDVCPTCGSTGLGRRLNEFIQEPRNARKLYKLIGFEPT